MVDAVMFAFVGKAFAFLLLLVVLAIIGVVAIVKKIA